MIVAELKKSLPLAGACLLLAILLFLQISCIFKESRTFDEILHLEAGLVFWQKRDFTIEPFNPPLARELIVLPLLFDQKIIDDPYLFWPRIITVLFSLGLAVIVYLWSKSLFSLLVLIFTPEILAHAHYANTDLVSTFFILLSLFLFDKYFLGAKKLGWKNYLLVGICAGLALATKTTAIFFVLIPIFSFWMLFPRHRKLSLKGVFLSIFAILIVIWSTYFFTLEPVLGYRADPNRQAFALVKKYPRTSFLLDTPIPLGGYLSTIKQNILSNQTNKFLKNTVFLGKFTQGVPGIYLWLVFLIKTPIPLLILLTWILLRKSRTEGEKFLKFTLIFILMEMIFLGSNLRLRYFLIVYPLLAILSGSILSECLKKTNGWYTILVGVLMAWLVTGTLNVFPNFLTFFNEISGGRDNGYKYVVDSNLDWGQGLLTLKKYLQEKKIDQVQLAYFGSVEPKVYGLSYTRVKDANLRGKKEIKDLALHRPLVISVSCWYYCGYSQNQELLKLKPLVLGGQFLLFNF